MEGAGDWERDVGRDVFGGGPFAQADLVESWVGFFCAVAVEGLLILQKWESVQMGMEDLQENRCTNFARRKKGSFRMIFVCIFCYRVGIGMACGEVVKNDLPAGEKQLD